MNGSMDRREFTRLFAFGGSAALLGHARFKGFAAQPLTPDRVRPGCGLGISTRTVLDP